MDIILDNIAEEGAKFLEHRLTNNFHIVTMREKTAGFEKFALASLGGAAAVAPFDRKHGIDVHYGWQGSYTPVTLKGKEPPKPVDFVVCKFSDGTWTAPNEDLNKVWTGARTHESAEGYHYWRTHSSGTIDRQYDSFALACKNRRVNHGWLDWETHNNLLTPKAYENAMVWMDRINRNVVPVGLYTNRSLFEQMNMWGKAHQQYPFWYAHYWNPVANPFLHSPVLPKECRNIHTWQYGITTSYGNKEDGRHYGVESMALDVNVRFEPRTPTTPIVIDDSELIEAQRHLQLFITEFVKMRSAVLSTVEDLYALLKREGFIE